MNRLFPIGTRGSPLALKQSEMVASALAAASGASAEAFPLAIIRTSGDMTQDRALADIGGKGLFTKEIDQAQLEGRVDVSVHSSKDLPTELPEGLVVAGYLEREDVRDAFIGGAAARLAELPHGATVGTVSLRRQALLRRLRPDLKVVVFRGNVETRLAKVARGEAAGTLLALAGLKRLGLADRATELLDSEAFPPAVGQGAIAIVARADDGETRGLIERIAHAPTFDAVTAERAMLGALDGSCRMPIAGHAAVDAGRIALRGMVLSPDGRQAFEERGEAARTDAAQLGAEVGARLKAKLPPGFLGEGRG